MQWWKYDASTGSWTNFDTTGRVAFAEDRMSVTLTLTDGGVGDADGIANGTIVDPSGLYIKDKWRIIWGPDGARKTNPNYFPDMENNGHCFINTAASELQ